MGRLKDFYFEEISSSADSDFSEPQDYAPGPADRAFPPLSPSLSSLLDPTITTVSVLMCAEGNAPPLPVNAFTFRADAERVLSLMEMGKRAYALPESTNYYIVEVPHDPAL